MLEIKSKETADGSVKARSSFKVISSLPLENRAQFCLNRLSVGNTRWVIFRLDISI